MRFERYNIEIVESTCTKLLLGQEIDHKERLNLIRYFAEAAKENNMKEQWKKFLRLLTCYENILDYKQIDKILLKWIPKLEIPQKTEEE